MNTGRMRESGSYLPLFTYMFSFITSLSLLLVEVITHPQGPLQRAWRPHNPAPRVLCVCSRPTQVGLCGQQDAAEVMAGYSRGYARDTGASPHLLWIPDSGGHQLPCREDTHVAPRGPRGEELRPQAHGHVGSLMQGGGPPAPDEAPEDGVPTVTCPMGGP